MALLYANQVFILELKMVENNAETEEGLDTAIAPIRDCSYAEKYRGLGEPIHLMGMAWEKGRNLLEVRVEVLQHFDNISNMNSHNCERTILRDHKSGKTSLLIAAPKNLFGLTTVILTTTSYR